MKKYSYSHLDVLFASPTEPIDQKKREGQLAVVRSCMKEIQCGKCPRLEHWEIVSDVVNMMKTLLIMGEIEDKDDALGDAMAALNRSGYRFMAGESIRLNGPDIALLNGVIEDYEMVLSNIPARTMLSAHRFTEKRLRDVMTGKKNKESIGVVA